MILSNVLLLFGIFPTLKSQSKYLPNLPMGKYRSIFEALYPCESTKNHSIEINIYFSKKSTDVTEIKGNVTLKVPFDNSLSIDFNIASWSLTGGWKENAYFFRAGNICSNMKNLLGNSFLSLLKAFNIPTVSCPLPRGTYVSSGLDVKYLEDNNLPKEYFYGKYRMTTKFKNKKNELIGCIITVMDIVRPWEYPKN